MEVDLRAVECTVAFIDGVLHAQIIQRAAEDRRLPLPTSSSVPMEFSGRVDSSTVYLKPKDLINLVNQTVQRP